MTTRTRKPTAPKRPYGSICTDCARLQGASWPEGHQATWSVSKCSECNVSKPCADASDWNWPGVVVRDREL